MRCGHKNARPALNRVCCSARVLLSDGATYLWHWIIGNTISYNKSKNCVLNNNKSDEIVNRKLHFLFIKLHDACFIILSRVCNLATLIKTSVLATIRWQRYNANVRSLSRGAIYWVFTTYIILFGSWLVSASAAESECGSQSSLALDLHGSGACAGITLRVRDNTRRRPLARQQRLRDDTVHR